MVVYSSAVRPENPEIVEARRRKLPVIPRGELLATPDPSNTSGDFAGLIGTDGFVELPAAQTDFPAGYLAPFHPWA